MPLSRTDIKANALKFSREWADVASEEAEAKPFLTAFFDVFRVSRRRVATFEERVTKQDGRDGYIDLLWKGVLLVEHKSRGKNLDRAFDQRVALMKPCGIEDLYGFDHPGFRFAASGLRY